MTSSQDQAMPSRTNGGAAGSGRVPPNNVDAERALLGAAMRSPDALEAIATEVEADDFFLSRHAYIHQALHKLWTAGIVRVDPILVSDELDTSGLLTDVGGTGALTELADAAETTHNASEYARIVVETATLRRIIDAGREIAMMAYERPENVAETCDMARHIVSTVELPIGAGEPSLNVADFLELEDEYDWLVPGLMERRDRVILTGAEGGGKSTMMRQLAVSLAAGRHPFKNTEIDPVRVLVVDVENSVGQTGRALAPMVRFASRFGTWNPDNLRIETRTDGLDLTSRHDSRWLMERVAANRPDVLITGPLYKLHADDPNDEMPARKVARVFDIIRSKYDCALLLEAHSPHGGAEGRRTLRPYGSSLWLRWPEFGYGLRGDFDSGMVEGRPSEVYMDAWRGPRDTRDWPTKLSTDGQAFWPFRDVSGGDAGPPPPDAPAGRARSGSERPGAYPSPV